MSRLLPLLLSALVIGGSVARADERKHVAVLEFAGTRAARVRGDVMRIAAAKCWLSSQSMLEGRSIRELADDYDLDLVVDGSLTQQGGEYHLVVRFLRGATGRTVMTASATLHRPSLDPSARRLVARQLDRALAAVPLRSSDDGSAQDPPR